MESRIGARKQMKTTLFTYIGSDSLELTDAATKQQNRENNLYLLKIMSFKYFPFLNEI